MFSRGQEAITTAALYVLDRARKTARGLTCLELRYQLWLEFVRLVATSATTMDFIREAHLAYEHICATYLFPPSDIFYPGDADYTYGLIEIAMRQRQWM